MKEEKKPQVLESIELGIRHVRIEKKRDYLDKKQEIIGREMARRKKNSRTKGRVRMSDVFRVPL